ncbi:hypothetical protein EV356DRAFT_509856 [Viridothelium virens]|uniref:Uncharacterized protein n=1 Tax=Viridothelium virens TaxID=1048519 RepID=A0A6A6HIJ2_VIRVR|nr:hypothetical protein EV356DRAFT_509856 [Viridothelium virens]
MQLITLLTLTGLTLNLGAWALPTSSAIPKPTIQEIDHTCGDQPNSSPTRAPVHPHSRPPPPPAPSTPATGPNTATSGGSTDEDCLNHPENCGGNA